MLKIHEFAHLGHVSGRMLRHYDAIGLLQPQYIDESTGYRYYALEQLPRLNRILALKDLGFRLEQIRDLIVQPISLDQLRGLLMLKQSEIQQLITVEQARLTRIASRLQQLESKEEPSAIEVAVISVPHLTIACLRVDIDAEEDAGNIINGLFAELLQIIRQSDKRPSQQRLLLWRSVDPLPQWSQLPIEVAIPIAVPLALNGRLQVRELAAVPMMATTLYRGPYQTMTATLRDMFHWVESNGFRLCGEVREWYLQRGPDLDEADFLTEIQMPIEHRG